MSKPCVWHQRVIRDETASFAMAEAVSVAW